MADEEQSVTPAPEPTPTPLDQAPLSEYVSRRAKGETAATAPTPPVETPAPSDDGEDTGDEIPPPSEKKPIQPPGKPKSRFEERLGTLTRQRHDAERALEAERQRVLQLQTELQEFRARTEPKQPDRPQPQANGEPPNLDQYLAAGKSYEDWLSALVDFRASRTVAVERQRFMQDIQQQQLQQQMAGFGERTEAARTKYADYEDVVIHNDRVVLSPVMQDIAQRSPHGPDIMYWLGTHEAEANAIGEMTRNYPQAAYPLVEAHLLLLSGSNGQAGAKKAVSVSSAPAPISPVGGGTTTEPKPLDQLPLGEYIKRREAEIKRRQG